MSLSTFGSMSHSGSQAKMPGLGSVTANTCRLQAQTAPDDFARRAQPTTMLCSQMQFMVQPLQSHCSVTKAAANCSGEWEGLVGMGTCPSQAVSLVPVPRCSVPTGITVKHLLARQGLLLLHGWEPMPHSCCTVQQTVTSHHAKWMVRAKGRPRATELQHDTWSSSSPSGNSSLSTCGSVRPFPSRALG